MQLARIQNNVYLPLNAVSAIHVVDAEEAIEDEQGAYLEPHIVFYIANESGYRVFLKEPSEMHSFISNLSIQRSAIEDHRKLVTKIETF